VDPELNEGEEGRTELGRAEPSISSALCAELDEVSVSPGCDDFAAGKTAVGFGSEAKPNEVWGRASDCFAPKLKVKGFLSPPPGAGSGPAPEENVVVSSFFSGGAGDVPLPKDIPLVLLSAFFSLGAPKENVAFFISFFFSAGATAGTAPKENPSFFSEVVDPKLNEGADGRTESEGVGVDVPPKLKAGALVVFPESSNLRSCAVAAGDGGTTVAPNVNPLLPVEVPDGTVVRSRNIFSVFCVIL